MAWIVRQDEKPHRMGLGFIEGLAFRFLGCSLGSRAPPKCVLYRIISYHDRNGEHEVHRDTRLWASVGIVA